MKLPSIAALSLFIVSAVAQATPKQGQVSSTSETWSGAIELVGDFTVPLGKTLNILAGTTITVATSDAQSSGATLTSVELIVNGTLNVTGTTGSPVVFQGAGISVGGWYGIRVQAGSTVSLVGARFSGMANGIELNSANTTISGCTLVSNNYGLYSRTATAVTAVDTTIISKTSNQAIYMYLGTMNADRVTVVDNPAAFAVHVTGGTTLSLTNSIVANNSNYGINVSGGTLTVSNSDVWGNPSGLSGYTLAAGNLTENPLFVDRVNGNYRLTSNSPARKAGVGGIDIGALPYVNDATVGWQGTLFTSQTLPTGTVNIIGDLTVAPGVTLTVLPGTTLTFAAADSMGAGLDSTRSELLVKGTLSAVGSQGSPILFTTPSATVRDWTGIRTVTGSSATLRYFTLRQSSRGLMVNTDAQVSDGTFVNNTTAVQVQSGMPSLTRLTFSTNGQSIYTTGGTTSVSYSVFSRNTEQSLYLYTGSVMADHLTIADNTSTFAVHVTGGTTLTMTNSIVASNSNYAINKSGGTLNLSFSDVWPNMTSGHTVTPGMSGMISSNPNFVDSAAGDYHLQSFSTCVGSGINGTDMGAFATSTGAINSVTLTPSSGSVAAGGTLTFTATAYDASNNVVPGATFTWSALPAAGLISNSGVLTASCTTGTVTGAVTATASGKSATVNVTINPGAASTVTVSPQNASVPSQATQAYTAVVKDSCNNTLTVPVTWSATSGAGSINASGLFTAGCTRSNYTNGITATAGSVNGTASVTVAAGALTSITVSPGAASLSALATQQFSASGVDGCSNAVTAPAVTWSTTVPGSNISTTGLFTAGSTAGTTVAGVKATAGTIVGNADVTIGGGTAGPVQSITLTASPSVAAGGMLQFTAQGRDSGGNPVNGLTYTWSALPAAGTISQSGLLTASCTPGTVASAVTVSTSGKTATASVTINPGSPASVVVSPASQTLASQAMQTFTAVAKDSCNNTLSNAVTWSANSATGSISQGGVLTAGCTRGTSANGVTATVGSISGSASVTVSAGPVSSMSVTPTAATLAAGGNQAFAANFADACGNPVTAPAVTWATTVTGASVTNTGLFTAGTTPGVTSQGVRATAGSLSATADITVQGGSVTQVTLTPVTVTLAQGATQQFTAEARDSSGNLVTGQTVTWSVVAGGGTVSTSGLFTAGGLAGTFSNTVRATVGSASATASVTVTAGVPHHIQLSPTTVTLAPGGSANFAAQVFDSANNMLNTAVTLSALSSAGTITQGGVFTAGTQVGTYSGAVTATVGSISASAAVTLSAGALSQLIVAPGVAMLAPGTTVAFQVTGRDAQGNLVPANATFSVANGGGTITQAGLFTAGNMAGTFPNTVKAEMNGLTAFASISIQPGPVVYVDVTPNFAQVSAGQTFQFIAQARDAFGNPVNSTVTWSVVDAQVGSISSAGLLTAGNTNGDFTQVVNAAAGGMVGTASVKVIGGSMMQVDAGVDSGVVDAGVEDAGAEVDAGTQSPVDAGQTVDAGPTLKLNAQPMGCACNSADGSMLWVLAGAALLLLRRRAA